MNLKKNLIVLFSFMIIFSFFLSFNTFPVVADSVVNNTGTVQQNSCNPIVVKTGSVVIPIDIDSVYGIYNYADYDFSMNYNSQIGYNYVNGTSYDQTTGTISNIALADGTQIVVVGHNYKNSSVDVISDFCFNQCPGLQVFNQQVNANFSFAFAGVDGVYNASQFDFGANPPNNQPNTTNFFTGTSSYSNGIVSGINLPDGTNVVVTGKDNQGNQFFMSCQPGSMTQYGVNPGDSMTYVFNTNVTNAIPFFGLNNNSALASNNDKIYVQIDQVMGSSISLFLTIGSNPQFSTNDSMFFVVPINLIKDLMNGSYVPQPGDTGPQPTLVTFDTNTTTVKLESPDFNGTIVLDNFHGTLVNLVGNVIDPQNNSISMKLNLVDSYFSNLTNNNGGNNGPAPTWGVQVGDSFKLQFETNAQGPIPFFDLNNGQVKISNGDILNVEVTQILVGLYKPGQTAPPPSTQSGPGITLTLTVGNQTPFKTDNPMFFVVPTNQLEALISGSANVGDNNTQVTLISANTTVAIFDMSVKDSSGTFTTVRLSMDRKHGTMLGFDGTFKDPQGNSIQMKLSLVGTAFKDNTSTDTSSNTTITQSLPSFEFLYFIPIFGLVVIARRKTKNKRN